MLRRGKRRRAGPQYQRGATLRVAARAPHRPRPRPPQDKFQVLVGAQVYEQQRQTYAEINECLALWKLQHVEFFTSRDDPESPASYWLRRRDPLESPDVHAWQFAVRQGGACAFDSGRLAVFAVKTEVGRTWHRLKIGEGKAENQNNMINALMGEVVNILDMNQDAYYSEGTKLPLILPQFQRRRRLRLHPKKHRKALAANSPQVRGPRPLRCDCDCPPHRHRGGSIEPPKSGGGGGVGKRAQLTGTINQLL